MVFHVALVDYRPNFAYNERAPDGRFNILGETSQ